jgi:hypothetical protein
MARPHLRDPKRERRWRVLLTRWQQSGLNVRDFCRRHHLAETAFYFWRRTITARDRQTTRPTPNPRSRPTSSPKSRPTPIPSPRPRFVPVRVVPDRPLEVVLRTGHVLRVPPGSDVSYLRAVVTALEAGVC